MDTVDLIKLFLNEFLKNSFKIEELRDKIWFEDLFKSKLRILKIIIEDLEPVGIYPYSGSFVVNQRQIPPSSPSRTNYWDYAIDKLIFELFKINGFEKSNNKIEFCNNVHKIYRQNSINEILEIKNPSN